jgi:hypothetical protein
MESILHGEHEIARINYYLLITRYGMAMVVTNNVFKKCAMKGIHPHHLVSGMIRESLV